MTKDYKIPNAVKGIRDSAHLYTIVCTNWYKWFKLGNIDQTQRENEFIDPTILLLGIFEGKYIIDMYSKIYILYI